MYACMVKKYLFSALIIVDLLTCYNFIIIIFAYHLYYTQAYQ